MERATDSNVRFCPDYIAKLPMVRRESAHSARDARARAVADFVRTRRRAVLVCRSQLSRWPDRELFACRCRLRPARRPMRSPQSAPQAVIARFDDDEIDSVRRDLGCDFREKLFRLMSIDSEPSGRNGNLVGAAAARWRRSDDRSASQVLSAEQSNSSMLFDNKFFLKLYRKLEDGVNPDVEVTRFLTERRNFRMFRPLSARSNIAARKRSRRWSVLLQNAIASEARCLDDDARSRRPILRARALPQSRSAK